ncbi:hypothetical protein NSTC731_04026 [Nostoc sp. DSM 114167]|jgi:hypothetical protein
MTGQIGESKQKYGYPLMLASRKPVDGGMSCSTNSIHYGNFITSQNSLAVFLPVSSALQSSERPEQ